VARKPLPLWKGMNCHSLLKNYKDFSTTLV